MKHGSKFYARKLLFVFFSLAGSSFSQVVESAGKLDGAKTPSENFDLKSWKITLPTGKEISELALHSFVKSNKKIRIVKSCFRSLRLAAHVHRPKPNWKILTEQQLDCLQQLSHLDRLNPTNFPMTELR